MFKLPVVPWYSPVTIRSGAAGVFKCGYRVTWVLPEALRMSMAVAEVVEPMGWREAEMLPDTVCMLVFLEWGSVAVMFPLLLSMAVTYCRSGTWLRGVEGVRRVCTVMLPVEDDSLSSGVVRGEEGEAGCRIMVMLMEPAMVVMASLS